MPRSIAAAKARPPGADRNPSRGYRQPAAAAAHSCAPSKRRFLLYCDDLSFDKDDTSYKSLKAALEGGIEGRPDNVLFYATSNRRHLMPRDLVDNERGTAINPGEAVEEKVSLSDRFGLWLGFHNCSQDDYLAMIEGLCRLLRIEDRAGGIARPRAGLGDGTRLPSGRVAWQFIQDLAGELGQKLNLSDCCAVADGR